MCKRIKNNDKKLKSSRRTSVPIDNVETSSATIVATETDNKVENNISYLDTLKNKESTLSTIICSEEAEHAQLISRRATLKSQFQKQQVQLLEITHTLESLKNDFETTLSEWEKLGSDMYSLTKSISKKKSTLADIRNEIIMLQKISIFIYVNGEIEFENVGNFDTTTDSSSESELFNQLIQNKVVESLTIKNIRQLAKLILIVQKLNAEHISFELTFEDSSIQEVFNSIN